jgi:hypothetical protein
MTLNGELRAAEFQGKVLEALEHLEHQMGKHASSLTAIRTEIHEDRVKIEHRMTAQEVKVKSIAAKWAAGVAFVSSLILAILLKVLLR